MRTGIGYDIHRLVPGRKLVLGGVVIPYKKGLLGHSDADVLIHALCDALLGAAALGDIGKFFPDADPAFKDMDSMIFLIKTYKMLLDEGYKINNIDSIIFAEAPRLSTFRDSMAKNIADAVEININQVNIKSTTAEGLGFIGKGEAIGAMCSVLISIQTT